MPALLAGLSPAKVCHMQLRPAHRVKESCSCMCAESKDSMEALPLLAVGRGLRSPGKLLRRSARRLRRNQKVPTPSSSSRQVGASTAAAMIPASSARSLACQLHACHAAWQLAAAI